MPKEKMWVEWEDGTHLSQSQKEPGKNSPLTREDGTNRLGHVTLGPIDEDEEDSLDDWRARSAYDTGEYASGSRMKERSELEDLLTKIALTVANEAWKRYEPQFKGWLHDRAFPAAESTWKRFVKSRKADTQVASTESHTLMEPAPADTAKEVKAAIEAHRAGMSSAEARERIVAALAARLVDEEHLRMPCNARVEDESGPSESNSARATLTTKQLGDSIKLVLESDPSLLGEEALVELRNILEAGQPHPESDTILRNIRRHDLGDQSRQR